VAAFVLKYRLNQTPADLQEFARPPQQTGSPAAPPPRPSPDRAAASLAPQVADARAAFGLVRKRAAEWNVDPDRIGMIGFSAGAMLAMTTALTDREASPAFVADIYGPLTAVDVPPDAAPLFVALAADDPLFPATDFGLVASWRAADRPVEFHYYERGGHGFGMYPKDTTSTGWFEAFISWLTMHGMTEPKG